MALVTMVHPATSTSRRLRWHLTGVVAISLAPLLPQGIDADNMEALAFAWLAHRRISNQTGNLRQVTGASRDTVLGAVFPP